MSGRMCPNRACGHYGLPTRLLGGCDCGCALVPFRNPTEPSNEQLARLVWAFSMGTPEVPLVDVKEAKLALDASPELRAAWLERHREMQAAWGAT